MLDNYILESGHYPIKHSASLGTIPESTQLHWALSQKAFSLTGPYPRKQTASLGTIPESTLLNWSLFQKAFSLTGPLSQKALSLTGHAGIIPESAQFHWALTQKALSFTRQCTIPESPQFHWALTQKALSFTAHYPRQRSALTQLCPRKHAASLGTIPDIAQLRLNFVTGSTQLH